MKTIQNIYIMITLLCLGYAAAAQNSTTTLTPGYWTFGLNAGLAYQSSDVRSTLDGFGFGATLGKNIFFQPGAPLAFDLRGRFLYTRQYGLDPLRSFNIASNRALNGTNLLDYTSYPADLDEPRGFVYQNFKTNTAELSLEGLLTLNRLRERTGVHVGLFGGIGLDWFKTQTDQADSNGNEYFEAYANINESRSNSVIRNELERALDGNYETIADGNSESGTVKFMPSLGLELGYQLSPNFLVYGGHRVTFSGTDALDGERFADPNNDLYHYTNLGLRWTINTTRNQDIARAPEIEIVTPLGSPYTTSSANGLVVANIRHINSAADVNCIVNDRSVNFSYRDGRFSIDTPLRPGTNEVIITAQNPHGMDRETILLVYREAVIETPRIEAPQVRITDPGYNNFRTEAENFMVRATIANVTDYRDIRFEVNGVERDFIFERGTLRANIPLREGNNRVQISATNAAGSDEAETNIMRENRIERPFVNITEPTGSRVESAYRNVRVTAQVRNVERSDQIQVLVNNRRIYSFEFDENKGYVFANLDLDNGENEVVIIAENRAGEARDRVTIRYREPLPDPVRPPSVRITEPNRAAVTTYDARVRIAAIIRNVNSRSNIIFAVNGRRSNNFNFDRRNGRLTANVNLLNGNNEILIRADNRDGQDEQRVAIRRLEEIVVQNPPIVRIYDPRNNSETDRPYVSLEAAIENVTNKSDINLVVNGSSMFNFDFNRATGRLEARIALQDGNNTIRIRATNRDGVDDETVNVRYRSIERPTVRITTPADNAVTDQNSVRIRADITNVDQRNQIRLTVNSQDVDFNFDGSRNELTANANLREGNNTIRVEAQNEAGTASDVVSISLRRPQPPTVGITRPTAGSTTSLKEVTVQAEIENVTNERRISFEVNGKRIGDFELQGKFFTGSAPLQPGANTIRVSANNEDGSAEDVVEVTYRSRSVKFLAPIVRFSEPKAAEIVVNESNFVVKAKTTNVGSAREITMWVNDETWTKFDFNARSQQLTTEISLQPGKNSVRVAVQNRGGKDEAEAHIVLDGAEKPVITVESISQPTVNPLRPGVGRSTIIAKIERISGKENVKILVNDAEIDDFSYNPKSKQLKAIIELARGENEIFIRATNDDGTTEVERTIKF